VLRGRTAELPLLLPDLLQIIVLPFVGAHSAAAEAATVRGSRAYAARSALHARSGNAGQ
jgi:hypothetical protein